MGLVDCSDDSHDGQSAERLTGHRTRSGGSSRRTSSSRRIGKAHSVRELPKLEDIRYEQLFEKLNSLRLSIVSELQPRSCNWHGRGIGRDRRVVPS